MCPQNQNVHIQLEESCSFQSIKYQFTTPKALFLPSDHLFAWGGGGYILLFSVVVVSNQDLREKKKTKRSEVPIQEVLPPTIITVYIFIYINVFVVNIYIYCHAEESCREESLSMLVQHGRAPSPSGFSSKYRMLGGPRLLGLSLDQGSYRNRH